MRVEGLRTDWTTLPRVGLSMDELAHQAGLHRTYVNEAELGKRNVALENIAKLAHALGLTIGELFEGYDGGGEERC